MKWTQPVDLLLQAFDPLPVLLDEDVNQLRGDAIAEAVLQVRVQRDEGSGGASGAEEQGEG